MKGTVRVWANESRGAASGSKGHCKHCGAAITWFTTVRNNRPMAIDGHAPTPLFQERDLETGRGMEAHGRETVHFATCVKRREARA